MPSDYNGNGNTDFACLKYKRDDNNNIVTNSGKPVYERFDLFVKKRNGQYIVNYTENINDETVELIPGDINGDGKKDLIRKVGNNYDFMISNGTGFDIQNFGSFNNMPQTSHIKLADFNGDGKDDILIYDIIKSTFIIVSPPDEDIEIITERGSSNFKIYTYNGQSNPLLYSEKALNYETRVDVANISGSRKANILVKERDFEETGNYGFIYEINEDNEFFDISTNNFIPKGNKGDFNGDGKTDFLYFSNNSWKIKYATGTGFADATILPNLNVSNYDKNMRYLADFDGNGLTDIIEFELYDEIEYENLGFYDFFYNINLHLNFGYSFEKKFVTTTQRRSESNNPHFPPPVYHSVQPSIDVNGDGKQDFIGCYFANGQSTVTTGASTFYPNEKKHLVKSITNGYNNKTQFYYKPLTDPSVYTKGSGANFPVIDFSGAIYVVQNLKTPNGIGYELTTKNYKYEGAKIHTQGKGFLGFSKIRTKNLSTGIVSETEFIYDPTYFNTYPISSKTYYNTTSSLISKNTIINQHIHHFGNKRIFTYPKETESTDYLTNTTVNTVTNIDNNTGNLMRSYTTTDDGNTETLYQNYIKAGAWLPTKPKKIIINKTATGKPTYTRISEFEYFNNGMLKKSITDPNDANHKITTQYRYNKFGNITKKRVSTLNEGTKISSFTYDSKNRFIISKKNPLNFTSYKTYDETTGNVLTQTDINGHTTKFKYDAFGSLVETESPDGVKTNQTTEWNLENNILKGTYTIVSSNGTAPIKTYFDKLGRKIKTESSGFNDNETIISEIEYNRKGQIEKTYEAHFEGSTVIPTVFNYDNFGRQTSIVSIIGTTRYRYNINGNPKKSKIIYPDNSFKTNTINSLGQITKVEDFGGTINYEYNSAGLPTKITVPGSSIVSITYDNYGNKLRITDPDAGTINYTYDAFSNIITQTDANNNTYEMEYDILGRITKKSGPDGTTRYRYDTSTNGKGMLALESFVPTANNSENASKITGSPNSKNYTYDNLSRLSSKTETFEKEEYTYSYNYDSFGRINKVIYPNGFAYNKKYKSNGYLQKISTENGRKIWMAENRNALGQITECSKGNGLTTYRTYDDYHQLESVVTGNIQNFTYNFEKETGNLLNRTDNYGNTENFTYDNLNRLTQINTNGNIFNTVYNNAGNIINKTDAGAYSYNNIKHVHAVTQVIGKTYMPSQKQNTSYTAFNKIAQIDEGSVGIIYNQGGKLNFVYGLDNKRKKTILTKNQHKIKYFFDSYEKTITKDGTITEYCFIPGGAIYKTTNGVGEMLYTYTDHLGSITHVTDNAGNLLAEQSFDAWGRYRNPETWKLLDVNSVANINIREYTNDRGYTGHEMLAEFALINMNGRLYDPVLGRMLSPDNYIQAPDFTQNFNRYSYVMNNPLKYTDPTGNKWWYWVIGDVLSGGMVSATATIAAPLSSNIVYETQKQISPLAVKLDYHIGTNQKGLGFNISFGQIKASPYSNRVHFGYTYYWNNFGDQKGWEKRKGGEAALLDLINFSGTTFSGNSFRDQTLNSISYGPLGGRIIYENDHMFHLADKLLLPHNVPRADCGDAFRTAAVKFEFGAMSIGLNMFTGDPGFELGNEDTYRASEIIDGHDTYVPWGIFDPDKYRAGVLYMEFGNFRIGRNEERIRQYFQNELAHDKLTKGEAKWFRVLDIDPTWYFYFGSGTGNTLW